MQSQNGYEQPFNDNALHCSQQVLLLQDNARPHATTVSQVLQRFGWTILEQSPYSLDLAPNDFHVFPAIKDRLSGHRFAGDEDVRTAVTRWFISRCPEFYETGINKLAPRLDKCLNLGGNYVEK